MKNGKGPEIEKPIINSHLSKKFFLNRFIDKGGQKNFWNQRPPEKRTGNITGPDQTKNCGTYHSDFTVSSDSIRMYRLQHHGTDLFRKTGRPHERERKNHVQREIRCLRSRSS
jgi:hypothetical protein